METYLPAILSAVFLGITVILDKLLIIDFYRGSVRSPWFISSTLGAILGLGCTFIAWLLISERVGVGGGDLIGFFDDHRFLVLGGFVAGVGTSLTLRSYFITMGSNSAASTVAVAIAITPLFIFTTELLLAGTGWGWMHALSTLTAVSGFVGFELAYLRRGRTFAIHPHLLGVVGFTVFYVIVLDQTLSATVSQLSVSKTAAALLVLPIYWLGFGTGIVSIYHHEVRSFLNNILVKYRLLLLVLLLELVGMGFYFFEVFGLSALPATLLAVIVGAHIILVWLADQYARLRYLDALRNNLRWVSIYGFRVPTTALAGFRVPPRQILVQALCIGLVIVGLMLWPN